MFVRSRLLAIALLVFSGATCAAQQLDFSIDGGNTFGNSFTIGEGSTTNVEVYLSEISPDTTLSVEGLFSLGLRADLDSAAFGTISSAAVNPTYDFVTSDNFNTIAIEWEAAVFANSTPTDSSVLLGSFQFDSTGAGVSSFTFGDIRAGNDPSNVNWFTELATELDESIFGPGSTETYSLTLSTAVPEPCAVPLMVLAAMLVGVRKRKQVVNV